MSELENLLKDILPEKRKPEKKKITSNKDIHHLVNGSYLCEKKRVFCSENREKMPSDFGNVRIDEFQIPEIIRNWAGISNQKNPRMEELLFIDTETTGLAGGTGTFAFLIGIGFYQDNNFVIRQYFMTDPSAEIILIEALAKELRKFSVFVSFNGKSFDIPLLRTRFVVNQKDFIDLHNLDLLHLSRRLWKNSLDSCTLQNLEKNILGKHRDLSNDIPGSEIPRIYFDFLENKDASLLKNVFHHNKIDIMSMVALLKIISEKVDYRLIKKNPLPVNLLEIGKLYEDCGESDLAVKIYNLELSRDQQNRNCLKSLSFLYKRNQQVLEAEKLWKKAAEQNEIYAFIELAKVEEHQRHNYQKALQLTEKAVSLTKQSYVFEMSLIDELVHRYRRLEAKIKSKIQA